MKTKVVISMSVILCALIVGQLQAQAAPEWYTIKFTGADMFNYTATTAPLSAQDAPRRHRYWDNEDITSTVLTSTDSNGDGTNDYAEWAQSGSGLSTFGFSYFNLWGATIASTSWDQPYHAVPDNGDGTFGVNSWRNQTVNGVPVIPSLGDPSGWAGGIVAANQSYNETDYAYPVWRAPTDTLLTEANAASLQFSVDVMIQNPDTAFEPDGSLRVWFGGFNVTQDSTEEFAQEIGGVMVVPEPGTLTLLTLAGLSGLAMVWIRRRRLSG
jgi:hypothetical protein